MLCFVRDDTSNITLRIFADETADVAAITNHNNDKAYSLR